MIKGDLLKMWDEPVKVLDHGFVQLIDTMGDDGAIVEAARQSTTGGRSEHKWGPRDANGLQTCSVCKGVSPHDDSMIHSFCQEGDRRLIRYMYRNGHTSPFEMAEIKLLCKMPIFVARQWIRHRTASVNEMSGRYTRLPSEFYVPAPERIGGKGIENKQGTEGPARHTPDHIVSNMHAMSCDEQKHYSWMLDEAQVANEIARMNLGVNVYTQWVWKIDLHNLLHFLALRCDEHAQWEIRQYAEVIREIVAEWVPLAYEAWDDYHPKRGGHTFSRQEMELLRHGLSLLHTDPEETPSEWWDLLLSDTEPGYLTKREHVAFLRKLGVIP